MLTEEQKQSIESLSTDEMAYEIALRNKSRFQREKFAYLTVCYNNRLNQNKATMPWHSKPLGQVAVGVIIIVLGSAALWVLGAYLNVHIG